MKEITAMSFKLQNTLYVSKLSSFNKVEYCRTKVVVLAEEEKVNFED